MEEPKKYFWHGRYFTKKQIQALKENNFKNVPKEKLKAISSKGGRISAERKKYIKALKKRAEQVLNDELFCQGYTEEFLEDFAKFRKMKNREDTAGKN